MFRPSNLRPVHHPGTEPIMESRRDWLRNVGAGFSLSLLPHLTGCLGQSKEKAGSHSELIFGQRGLADGRFQKPRAIAIDEKDRCYVVDKTGRIQMFDSDGKFLRGWRTPAIEQGKPTGLSVDADGTLAVADTHYFRFLFYTDSGTLLENKTIGGENGPGPGQFAFVTDLARLPTGEYILSEYGQFDRIHKFTPDGKFIAWFGENGNGPLQFSRPQCIHVDKEGLLWIADACNHRVQVVDWNGDEPKLIKMFGKEGSGEGELKYPYGIVFDGDHVIISEYGNHRVQKLTREGRFEAFWGSPGSQPGQLNQPWAVATDSRRRVYVVDSGNNRVQRFQWS